MEGLSDLWRIFQVVFGIGLVIFVHEAGHFVAARLCRVRVEVFSLGFGPRLFGVRRRGTLYQVAVVPLGGYVKMAGEELAPAPHDDRRAESPPEGEELWRKSVGQRFFIYSGGVLMNVLFGLVVFPFVLFAGVPVLSPVLGPPLAGSPAWHAGLDPGTRVLAVNGKEVFDFLHIPTEVALNGSRPAVFEVLPPDGDEPRTVTLMPSYDPARGVFVAGVTPAPDPELRVEVIEGSPAERAGLASGDRLLGVVGLASELSVREQLLLAIRERDPVELLVQRAGESEPRRIAVPPSIDEQLDGQPILGVEPAPIRIEDVRRSPLVRQVGLEADDRLLAVQGRPVERHGDVLEGLLAAAGEPLRLSIEREGANGPERRVLESPALDREAAVSLARDLSIVGDLASSRVSVLPGSGAEQAGVRSGDRVVSIGGSPVRTWEDIPSLVEEHGSARAGPLVGERETDEGVVTLAIEVTTQAVPRVSYDFNVRNATYVYRVGSVPEAIVTGVRSSWRFLVDVWLTLKGIASQEVSPKNIGGIITIAAVSHDWASEGWSKLFFFLCLLSMNLAFLNVLPIPVLDGGHLFFLLVEKIKGSPVSERTLGYSQMVGLVLIVSLMVYVTYNDVVRWFHGS